MAAEVFAELDEENQIIEQRITGEMIDEDFERLTKLTERCVERLRDPQRVLILTDGRAMAAAKLSVRRRGLQVLEEGSVRKLAIYGSDRFGRMVGVFLSMMVGKQRMRFFVTRDEAVAWLLGQHAEGEKSRCPRAP